jgi:hypothetical protein
MIATDSEQGRQDQFDGGFYWMALHGDAFLSTRPNDDRDSTMIDRHLHWNLF